MSSSHLPSVDKLLRVFLEKHAHLALAVDEYGGAVGIPGGVEPGHGVGRQDGGAGGGKRCRRAGH